MNKVIAICSDLFFAVKIQDAAKRAGLQLVSARTVEAAVEAARRGARLVILDLNDREVDTVAAVRALKEDPETAAAPLLAFLSHVDVHKAQAAREAGCDRVMARSRFSTEVVKLLAEAAG